jgi:hypothetical protein
MPMNVTRLSPSRRRKDVRAWWSEHLQAQRHSGETQVEYCRARGIDPKYFTLWKRKLLDAAVTTERDEPPRLVPVVVRSERGTSAPTEVSASSAAVAIRLNQGNGMSVSLEVAAGALGTLVRELAAVRC